MLCRISKHEVLLVLWVFEAAADDWPSDTLRATDEDLLLLKDLGNMRSRRASHTNDLLRVLSLCDVDCRHP